MRDDRNAAGRLPGCKEAAGGEKVAEESRIAAGNMPAVDFVEGIRGREIQIKKES